MSPASGDEFEFLVHGGSMQKQFPINRCHQRVVAFPLAEIYGTTISAFPINRCHQRVVTPETSTIGRLAKCKVSNQSVSPASGDSPAGRSPPWCSEFPINRCHQRVVTGYKIVLQPKNGLKFPINKCHQRVVTGFEITIGMPASAVSNQ